MGLHLGCVEQDHQKVANHRQGKLWCNMGCGGYYHAHQGLSSAHPGAPSADQKAERFGPPAGFPPG